MATADMESVEAADSMVARVVNWAQKHGLCKWVT